MKKVLILLTLIAFIASLFVLYVPHSAYAPEVSDTSPSGVVSRSELPREVYFIMYEKGTERPFSSPLNEEKRKGTYVSADTGLPLFRSEDKYDSGTGWPSFVRPIDGAVELKEDNTFFTKRVEVVSRDTGAHLGHVFNDGPIDRGGMRYCMNGLALVFVPDEEE